MGMDVASEKEGKSEEYIEIFFAFFAFFFLLFLIFFTFFLLFNLHTRDYIGYGPNSPNIYKPISKY